MTFLQFSSCISELQPVCENTVTAPLVRILIDIFNMFNSVHGGTINGKHEILDRFEDVSTVRAQLL